MLKDFLTLIINRIAIIIVTIYFLNVTNNKKSFFQFLVCLTKKNTSNHPIHIHVLTARFPLVFLPLLLTPRSYLRPPALCCGKT